jgi:hypothetical protein
MKLKKMFALFSALVILIGMVGAARPVKAMAPIACDEYAPFCTEVFDSIGYEGAYTGHDEPSVLFYSNTPGAGNSNIYKLTLPTDPQNLPKQDGSGGTFSFQLHPAFWFGMAMCDDQSAPNPGGSAFAGPNKPCTPDSDASIYTSTSPSDPHYIGKHPGGAYMEMQFYAPGWIKWPPGDSCDPSKWCAALNIDSFNNNQNTGASNNDACLETVGVEPVNFAFITKNGVASGPANPVDATGATYTPDPSKDLMMESGDTLIVDMHDTPDGFEVVIHDLTKGTSGSMKASVANGFGHVIYDPSANNCTVTHEPFHPEYASSSENTRLTWTAHSYNVAFSDEIGHFEYCNTVDGQGGDCTGAGVNDPGGLDVDDEGCFAPPFLPPVQSTRVKVGGCLGTDIDFDGVPYQPGAWPGNGNDANASSPISFSSPKFNGTQNYDRVAFETDLPRIEVFGAPNNCNRTTGAGCVNPPNGANFYPFYNANTSSGQCRWYEGGAGTPHNAYNGVNSTSEFGALLALTYPTVNGTLSRINNFRNVLGSNPCPG